MTLHNQFFCNDIPGLQYLQPGWFHKVFTPDHIKSSQYSWIFVLKGLFQDMAAGWRSRVHPGGIKTESESKLSKIFFALVDLRIGARSRISIWCTSSSFCPQNLLSHSSNFLAIIHPFDLDVMQMLDGIVSLLYTFARISQWLFQIDEFWQLVSISMCC